MHDLINMSFFFLVIPVFLSIPNFLALTITSTPYHPTTEDILTTMASMNGSNIDCPNQNGTHTMCDIKGPDRSNFSLYPSRYYFI